ncbi:MAG: DUF3999 domain-containing protein [Halothiobacillaceae bacterium]|nr:MAG: DUF3999 domain-containing protein [Halothiobacillaceae bacterium]
MKTVGLLMILLLPPVVAAEPPRPDDFAWGAGIEMPSASGLQLLTLPFDVLAGMTRDDRGDLRVFNATGQAVPHGFVPAQLQDAPRIRRTLPIFPLTTLDAPAGASTREPLPDLEIERDRQGQVLRITQRPGPRPERTTLGYLIDNSRAELPLVELELEWSADAAPFARIEVEGSDDLEHWRSLAQASLADMRFGHEHLQQRTITLQPIRLRYLRLRWLSDARPMLDAVHGQFRDAPPERWDERVMPLEGGKDAGAWRFNLPGPVGIERLALEAGHDNVLYQGRVLSRRDRHADWIMRAPLLQYRISMDGELLGSDPVRLPPSRDREWLVRLDQPETAGQEGLSVRIGWRPRQIMFIASGPAPFMLAWGNPAIEPAPGISAPPEARDRLPAEEARIGETRPLGGEARLKPPFRWQTLLLWGVLLAGVGLMGWMAMRLARQMGGR